MAILGRLCKVVTPVSILLCGVSLLFAVDIMSKLTLNMLPIRGINWNIQQGPTLNQTSIPNSADNNLTVFAVPDKLPSDWAHAGYINETNIVDTGETAPSGAVSSGSSQVADANAPLTRSVRQVGKIGKARQVNETYKARQVDEMDTVKEVSEMDMVRQADEMDNARQADEMDRAGQADDMYNVRKADKMNKTRRSDEMDKARQVDEIDTVREVGEMDKVRHVVEMDMVRQVSEMDKVKQVGEMDKVRKVSEMGKVTHVDEMDKVRQVGKKDEFSAAVRHVAFLKVHKTGSSTVQNLFLRFGDHNNLTFILGRPWKENECKRYHHCISFTHSLHDGNIMPPPAKTTFDILCSHVIYDKAQFRKYLPNDTRVIGLVREPTDRLASAIAFFRPRHLGRLPLTEYARDPTDHADIFLNNGMAHEFGFASHWFPNKTHGNLSDEEIRQVKEYVDEIFSDFSIILVTEKLDESLVLMMRLLNWDVLDIVYHNQLVMKHRSFKTKNRTKLREYLYLDYILYETAVRQLELQIAAAGPDFADEVENFKKVNKMVNNFCTCRRCEPESALTINATQWNDGMAVSRAFCVDLLRKEIPYHEKIRVRQYGTVN